VRLNSKKRFVSYRYPIRSMVRPNRERNFLVYYHWQDGRTVDETKALTGIPRSTVGYYYKKFNHYAKMGMDPPAMVPSPQSTEEAYGSAFAKFSGIRDIQELLRTGDPISTYYRLATLKLALEFFNYCRLNVEERRQLPKVVADYISAMIDLQKAQQQTGTQDRSK